MTPLFAAVRPDIPRHRRLGVRLAAAVTVVTLITLSFSAWVMIRTQRAETLDELRATGVLFLDTIRSSTHVLMLQNRKEETFEALQRIGAQQNVIEARILDKRGRVGFSTRREEIDSVLTISAPSCTPCHAVPGAAASGGTHTRTTLYTAPGGRRVLGLVAPIMNEPACAGGGCHASPAAQPLIGVLEVALSVDHVEAELARRARNTALLMAAAVLVVAALVWGFAHRYVLQPVRELLTATARVAGGDFNHPVPVHTDDELGRLTHSFNEMSGAIVRAQRERQALLEGLERQVEERTAALREAQTGLLQAEKLASLGTLSASIAHEINNPLAGILTFSKLLTGTLEEGPPDDSKRAAALRHLALIQRESERCKKIVQHLLDFARERPLRLTDVDINGPLDEALGLARHKLDMQAITLERDLGHALVVRGDFDQLRQAFLNLVLNACDAMPGGGALSLTSRRRAQGHEIAVSVRDTGSGIPPEIRERIFDPFFTTKAMGTGLGLSVVYGIVEKHRGHIEVVSEPGKGTTMTIVLPRAPE